MQQTIPDYRVEPPPTRGEKPEHREIPVTLSPAFVTKALMAAVLAMGFASTAVQWLSFLTGKKYIFGLVRLLNLDGEANFPTALSVLLLAMATLLLAVVSWNERRKSKANSAHWTMLTAGFCFMTLDEFAMLHELLVGPSRKLIGTQNLGLFYYAWVIPASVGVAVLAIYFLSFLRRLPKETAFRFVLSGVVYLGGCIGVEMLGGMRYEQSGSRDTLYIALVTLEELMEMAGVTLFIRALLLHLKNSTSELRFSIRFSNR